MSVTTKNKFKVVIVGLGYVGLPTLVATAKSGKYNVVGFDIDEDKINKINKKISPIEDKDVKKYLKLHKIFVTSDKTVFKNIKYFIVCVPTPVHSDSTPDYSIIINVAKTIAPYLTKGCHFVLESTVNPGTCNEIIKPILEKGSGLKAGRDFNLAHCPERINPGDLKWNIYNINRNIGSINPKFNHKIALYYRSIITQATINEVDNLEIAEATKIIENTFRDINIAYVNELAKSFDAMGIDLYATIEAASNKPFGFMPHWPGAGVGGHCIAVDPYYLIQRAALSGFDHKFLKLAREINNSMPEYTVHKLILSLKQAQLPVEGTRVTLLGLSYKPDVGDNRESPAYIIRRLLEKLGVKLVIYDPYLASDSTTKSLADALKNSKAVIIATAHQEFINKLPLLLERSTVRIVIDGRNCLNKNALNKTVIYKGIGR